MPSAPHRASSHPSTTTSTTTSHPSTRTSVRRNLFQSQLSRRGGESSSSHSLSHPSQPYHRPTTSSTSTSAETLRLDIDIDRNGSGSNSGMGLESTDIVIRDKNGDFEVLAMQSLEEDGDDDMGGRGGGGGFSGRGGRGGMGEEGEDGEQERQRLADAVKHHQRDRNRAPSEPAELYEAVRASLRAKTTALAEDNWMFEAEPDMVVR